MAQGAKRISSFDGKSHSGLAPEPIAVESATSDQKGASQLQDNVPTSWQGSPAYKQPLSFLRELEIQTQTLVNCVLGLIEDKAVQGQLLHSLYQFMEGTDAMRRMATGPSPEWSVEKLIAEITLKTDHLGKLADEIAESAGAKSERC